MSTVRDFAVVGVPQVKVCLCRYLPYFRFAAVTQPAETPLASKAIWKRERKTMLKRKKPTTDDYELSLLKKCVSTSTFWERKVLTPLLKFRA